VTEQEIENLKNDPQFQENLKKLEDEVNKSDSLAKIYQLLDTKLAIGADEEEIHKLFQRVVDLSFSTIAQKIETNSEFDLSNPNEWAAARGIYEYAIQRYSQNDTKSAQELFLALYATINHSEIKDAMMVHAAAIGKGYGFDDFFNKLAKINDVDFNDPMAVFVVNFVQPVDILLEMFKDEVKKLNQRLEKLKKAQEEAK
jgi:hypothetical protein